MEEGDYVNPFLHAFLFYCDHFHAEKKKEREIKAVLCLYSIVC